MPNYLHQQSLSCQVITSKQTDQPAQIQRTNLLGTFTLRSTAKFISLSTNQTKSYEQRYQKGSIFISNFNHYYYKERY